MTMIVTNTPAKDLAYTNFTYCSPSDLSKFAVPGSKLFLALVGDAFVLSIGYPLFFPYMLTYSPRLYYLPFLYQWSLLVNRLFQLHIALVCGEHPNSCLAKLLRDSEFFVKTKNWSDINGFRCTFLWVFLIRIHLTKLNPSNFQTLPSQILLCHSIFFSWVRGQNILSNTLSFKCTS